MKTLITFSLLIILSLSSWAQTVPNSDFENWTNVNLYEDPQGYSTSNLQSYFTISSPNVTKSNDSHSGNFAAKIETHISGNDTIFGMITNGDLTGGNLDGGVPYTSRPDSLHFSAKYNVTGGDSATIVAMFKAQGNVIGIVYYQFEGTANTYSDISVPITWLVPAPMVPDSMIFVAVSSNPDIHPVNGNWMLIDDIKFDNITIAGGSFESWIMHSFEDATYWNSFNYISAVFPPAYAVKTTDSYSGTYAMKITTTLINNNQDTLAHITNGRLMMADFAGGMATQQNPHKVSGYYKYTPVGFDSALVALRAYGFDNQGVYQNMDNNIIKLPPASSYTYFEIDLSYTGWPNIDTLGIAFASSNIYDGYQWAKAGSVLIIDSINIEYYPVGMAENITIQKALVYPNPASNIIYFDIKNKAYDSEIQVYNIQGQEIINRNIKDNSLDVSSFVTGLYFYRIISDNSIFQGKFNVKH